MHDWFTDRHPEQRQRRVRGGLLGVVIAGVVAGLAGAFFHLWGQTLWPTVMGLAMVLGFLGGRRLRSL